MKIEINAEQVDQLVRDTLLKAGIGKAIEEAVKKTMSPHHYDNPIDSELKKYMRTVVQELLKTEFKDQIDAAVHAALVAKVTAETMERAADHAISGIVKAMEDRD